MSIKRSIISLFIVVLCLSLLSAHATSADGQQGQRPAQVATQGAVTVTLQGVVQVINGNTWVIDGTTLVISSSTAITGTPAVGSKVTVTALQGEDGKLIMQMIKLELPAPTQAPTMAATSAVPGSGIPYTAIIIEGPVEEVNININVIVIRSMRIRLRADDPLRLKVKVGDWVRINGNFDRDSDNQVIVV